MIYLFNDVKELTGTVRNNHILNLLYEREKNGIYSVSAEIPVTYNDQGTVYNYNKKIQKSDFLGHYDKEGRFQLHKIAAVDIENGSIFVKGIHIFFDEAKAGAIIKDRRFDDREIIDGARVAFESIGWSVADFDVSVGKTYNFYNVTPLEARQILVETFGFEFDYWLDFDGKKVTNRHVAVKEKIGEKTNKRYTYGHNVLNIRAEQDYSEIYTAVIGRGKGEEIEETGGYGRRIEYTNVVWTTPIKPLNKPAGSRILEDPNATQLFGYKENGVVKPRIKVEVFSDIESPTELIQASYEWLMDNNVPKAVFSLKVADGDGLNLGDEVYVIYRDIDLVKSARVEKVIDDLVSGNRDVEFGDTAYFDTDRRLSGLRTDLKRYSGETGDRIYRLKQEANRRFDEIVNGWKDEFDQVQIDIQALIEADRENMETLLDTKLTEFDTAFNADMEAAYEEAQRNYTAIEGYVNTTVDTNRSQVEQIINAAEQSAKDYAEQQAQEKAEAVRTDLETVTSGHQQMLDDLERDVINIDDFLGDSRTVTLDQRFQNITQNFEERIRNIDSTHFNMIRGTSFDNPDLMSNQSSVEIITNETDNFARLGLGTTSIPYIMPNEYFNVEAGQTYHLLFMYRTSDVPEIDFIRLRPPFDPYGADLMIEDGMTPEEKSTTMTGEWTKKEVTFVSDRDMPVRLLLGTNFGAGNTQRGILDIKKPYLTTTNNREWLPHPDDNMQNVSEIVRRVTLLEDGQSELITRTEYNFETGQLDQFIKSVEETVEGNKTVLQRVEDWQVTNGASIEETIYGFDQKVWLNDVANIGANLIPQSANAWEDGGLWTGSGNEAGLPQHLRTKERIKIQPNTTYTLSSNSTYVSRIERVDIHQYLTTGGWINRHTIPLNGDVSFTTWSTAGTVRITLVPREGFSIPADFIDYPDGRIKIKLEVGDTATPMLNAISRIEQLANSVSIQVQELDGEFLSQSDIQVQAGYVQLGSQRLGDEQLASIFRVSPDSIDAITERMTLNGDLYVDGDITALAVDAIEGRFSTLWAAELETVELRARHIGANAIGAQHLWIDTALINKLSSSSMFTDFLYAKTINAIDINAGQVRSAILEADVITGDHLAVGTTMIRKLFATSGRIDELITKTHFVTEMHALTLDVVELNASEIRARLLTANTIEAEWLKGGTALIDRLFSSTAMFERMMAKSGFVTTLNTVTIDTDQLTIRRPDGVAWVSRGQARGHVPVFMEEMMTPNSVSWSGQNYLTTSNSWQRIKFFYSPHEGSTLRIVWAVSFSGASASEVIEVRVNGFGGYNPINMSIGQSTRTQTVIGNNTEYITQDVPMPPPNYRTMQGYLEFRRSPDGAGHANQVRARVLHIGQYN